VSVFGVTSLTLPFDSL